MSKYFTFDAIAYGLWTVFWGVFYAWTAVSLLAVIFSTAERAWAGVSYGAGFARGMMIAIAGIVGVVVGWIVLPLMTGSAPFAMKHSLFSGAFDGQKLGLMLSVVSTLVFNYGVWLALTSENFEPQKG